MNKTPAIQILRSRMLYAWVSPFVSAGLILSFILCCMCGPFCGSVVAEVQEPVSGCCASHSPEAAPEAPPCCPSEPGELCCDADISEHVLLVSIPEFQLAVPAVVLFIADRFEMHSDAAHSLVSEISCAEYSPPSYLRFQSFLI